MGEEDIGLGFSIEIQGDWAYVGAGLDLVDGVDSGSVHIYHFDGTQWVDQGRIVPPDPQIEQFFGQTVTVDGDTMMVGALFDNDLGEISGAVYVFDRVEGQWKFVQKLHPSDGRAGQGFAQVFLHGDMAVVGAGASSGGPIPGAAYVFERTESGWVETQKLMPFDSQGCDLFGAACMFDGEWLVIGAPHSYNGKFFVYGGAYVFHREDGIWTPFQKLRNENMFWFYSDFGNDVAIEGGQIFVGQPRDDGVSSQGSVCVFELNDGDWVEVQKLIPNSDMVNNFGFALALFGGDTLIVSAPTYPDYESGAAELFINVNGSWQWSGTIFNHLEGEALYGQRLALSDDIAMVFAQDRSVPSREVFVYSLSCGTCDADLNGDAALDVEDVSAFLSAYSAGSMQADFTMDGALDFFDVSAFLVEFSAGCP